MFKELEPTMKTEVSTRRALEKCMFERWVFLVSVSLEILNDKLEMLAERDRCKETFLYLNLVRPQAIHTAERTRTNRTETQLDMGLNRILLTSPGVLIRPDRLIHAASASAEGYKMSIRAVIHPTHCQTRPKWQMTSMTKPL